MLRVVRPRTGFGMELNAHDLLLFVMKARDRLVIQVDMRDLTAVREDAF